jgi:hypothetical protein
MGLVPMGRSVVSYTRETPDHLLATMGLVPMGRSLVSYRLERRFVAAQ